MGALTSNRKRGDDFSTFNNNTPRQSSPEFRFFKKLRFSLMLESTEKSFLSSNSTVSRLSRYPEAKPPIRREVLAPCRNPKFGLFLSRSAQNSRPIRTGYFGKEDYSPLKSSDMGNSFGKNNDGDKRSFFKALHLRHPIKDKEVVVVEDYEPGKHGLFDDSSVEEVQVIEDRQEFDEKIAEERNFQPSSSSAVTESNNGSLRVDNEGKMLGSLSLNRDVVDLSDVEAYKNLLNDAQRRSSSKLKTLDFEIDLNERRLAALRSLRPVKKPVEEIPREPFIPLTDEEMAEVERALSANNRRKTLVTHKNSNIDISGQVLQCLRPRQWLNDEVINLYLELLKERENRDPKKFLKCHFFNTFFYKKLTEGGYNYRSVRRWTSERKLGYLLINCDKIFVPIHKEIHWCLAIINKKDQKLQYLDSLRGIDPIALNTLAKYFIEEVKDKSGKDIDISSWEREYVEDLPEQENGFDCGMFMLKYIDFYSRGLGLCFNQEHMPYFRMRTAMEILRLRAD